MKIDAHIFSIIGILITPISILILIRGSNKLHHFAKLLILIGLALIILGIIFTPPLSATKIFNRIIFNALLCLLIFFIYYVFGRRSFLSDNDLLKSSSEMKRFMRILFPNYNLSVKRLRIENTIGFLVGLLISLMLLALIFKMELFFIIIFPFVFVLDLFKRIYPPMNDVSSNGVSNIFIIITILGWLIAASGFAIYKIKRDANLLTIRVLVVSGFVLFLIGLLNMF